MAKRIDFSSKCDVCGIITDYQMSNHGVGMYCPTCWVKKFGIKPYKGRR